MQKLNLNELVDYHEYWRENLKPSEDVEKYIYLSRKLLHKVIDNDGILSGITLSYPEDCLGDGFENYRIFQIFLDDILRARYSTKQIDNLRIVTFD